MHAWTLRRRRHSFRRHLRHPSRLGDLQLDLLLYLDHTMSSMTTRLAMSRLARVQAASHGHPMTTGLDSASGIDYFVSWAAAELPLNQAQGHYTERLAMPRGWVVVRHETLRA